MANAPMLPTITISANGQIPAAGATPYNMAPDPDSITALKGPLTIQENGQNFLKLSKAVTIKDGTASLPSGGALANLHALSLFLGNIGNRVATFYSATMVPNAAYRHVPAITLGAGLDLFIQAYQLSGAAAEINVWTLYLA